MDKLTFVPVWVAQDVITLVVAAVIIVYIVRKEEHPAQILLELICFCLLDAAVYENFASMRGLYAFGRSFFMIVNVPITVPLVEYLVIYSTLRILQATKVPTWVKPFVVGVTGMIFDFSLDPVATMQVFSTPERTIGRWSWFIGPNDVQILGEPVYNYTGWILLCGYGAAFLLLGRYWHRKSNYSSVVGYAYPVLTMVGALAVLVTPLSNFLLWLGPFCSKGSNSEWVMLAGLTALSVVLFGATWGGKMTATLSLRKDLPLVLVLVGLPVVEAIFTIVGRYWNILPLEAGSAAVMAALVLAIVRWSRRKAAAP